MWSSCRPAAVAAWGARLLCTPHGVPSTKHLTLCGWPAEADRPTSAAECRTRRCALPATWRARPKMLQGVSRSLGLPAPPPHAQPLRKALLPNRVERGYTRRCGAAVPSGSLGEGPIAVGRGHGKLLACGTVGWGGSSKRRRSLPPRTALGGSRPKRSSAVAPLGAIRPRLVVARAPALAPSLTGRVSP